MTDWTTPEDAATPGERAVADIIRTFWPVPPRTLAEGLEYRADLLDNGDPDGDTANVLRTLATHARQMERDLTEARAEVERLTAERTSKESLPVDLPAPADVKPGEAWIVECRGERRTAVKDRDDDVPWNTVAADGLFFSEENENVTLLHRLVPAPRVITNPDELDRLAEGTIVRDKDGDAWRRTCDEWTTTADYGRFTSWAVSRSGPVTVLWEPGA